MKHLETRDLERIRRYLKGIREKAPPCPDPMEGGCIAEPEDNCIWCASGEVLGILGLDEEVAVK